MFTQSERSIACLKGLATGDAIGKQTEMLKRDALREWYPSGVSGFHGLLGSVIPRYAGKRYEWRIGETTDDTEQSIAIAETLMRDRLLSHSNVGRALMKCRKSNQSGTSLGRFQQRGEPDYICTQGDGCGAAMRVTPIGVAYSSNRLPHLIEAVFESCIPTHGGQFGICAAVSFAAAVSAAIDGKSPDEVFSVALDAAKSVEQFRPPGAVGNMATILQRMRADLDDSKQDLSKCLQENHYFPDQPAVIVPLAISLALVTKSSRETILLATNIGGDTDSVAAMGGALAAAMHPETIDAEWFAAVEKVNNHGLIEVATRLATLRQRSDRTQDW